MFVFCIVVLCCTLVHGQFPRVCTTDEAFALKSCCPLWKDGSPCGENSGRGKCRNLASYTTYSTERVRQLDDDRLNWPRYYYDKTCECLGTFSGYDCGDCKYGYFGEKCDRQKTVVRKEIRELSVLERKRFFSYLVLAKTTKSKDFVVLSTGDRYHRDAYRFVDATIYNIFAWIHYYSIKPILRNGVFDYFTNYAHEGPAFPGWHRLGLLFMERQIHLLTGDEDFAIPYYDWRGEEKCSICNDDFLGDNDKQGILSEFSHFSFWKSICSGYNYDDAYCLGADDDQQMESLHRKPGASRVAPTLPSYKDVEDTLKLSSFDRPPYNSKATNSFRNALEGFLNPSDGETLQFGMHNLVHMFFGGTMAEVPISSNDPMFMLHHCFLDKIFEEWLRRQNATSSMYPKNDRPGQGPDECCTPYFPCVRNKDFLRRSTSFGYVYSEYQGL